MKLRAFQTLFLAAFLAFAGTGCGTDLADEVHGIVDPGSSSSDANAESDPAPPSSDKPSAADLFRILFAAGRDPAAQASAAPISNDEETGRDHSHLDPEQVPNGGQVSATSPDPAPERGADRDDDCDDGYAAYGDKCLPEDLVAFLEELASSPDPAPEDND